MTVSNWNGRKFIPYNFRRVHEAELEKMKFGIIGCGDIAENSFAPSLMKSKKAELVAVCRRNYERARLFADRFGGCKAYRSADELIGDKGLDAVIISTPTDFHCEYTLKAAEAGLHVLCEKPMAHDRVECKRMIQACEANNVTLGVAYRRRLFPQIIKAKSLIAKGKIGRVVCVRTHYSGWSSIEPGEWRISKRIGGAMMEMAVHRLEVLLNFADTEPATVSALVETVEQDWPVDDTNVVMIQFMNGIVGVHSTLLCSRPRRDMVQVDGTEGRIMIDALEFGQSSISLEDERGIEKIYVDPLNAPYFDLPMIDDFATASNKAKRPVCDGFTGYRVQAVVDAAFESHETGKRISVETITT